MNGQLNSPRPAHLEEVGGNPHHLHGVSYDVVLDDPLVSGLVGGG